MTKTAEINHQTEAMIAENQGHDLGCFEELAEVILEGLAEQGVSYGAGAFSEIIGGVSLLDRMISRLIADPEICSCDRPAPAEAYED